MRLDRIVSDVGLLTIAALLAAGCGDDNPGGETPTTGTIEVVVSIAGPEVGAAEFSIALDGVPMGTVSAGTTTFTAEGVASGEHTIAMGGLSAGCTVAGANPRTVVVEGGSIAATTFAITCD